MKRFVLSLLALLVCSPAMGGLVVDIDNSTVYDTPGLVKYATTGGDMAGMVVTATFADGSTNSSVWQVTGTQKGAASGSGWSLSQANDTFGRVRNTVWELRATGNSSPIVGLNINAGVGGVVFDRVLTGDVTPGSALGRQIELRTQATTFNGDIFATYSNPVTVAGSNMFANHDLYATLSMAFDDGGITSGKKVSFWQDTDNMLSSVPEPSSAAMLGLAGLGLVLRRRRS